MEKDASLLFGFSSKNMRFTEYGSSVVRSGYFTDHSQIIPKGNLDIRKTSKPHITFHPPTTSRKIGIAHMVEGRNGKVDEWNLDWFPVNKPQALLFAYTGDIDRLDETEKLKGNHQIVSVHDNVNCLRMELILHPIPKSTVAIGSPNTINILGFCPNYIVCCHFHSVNMVDPADYIATDVYNN